MAEPSSLEYSQLSERAQKIVDSLHPDEEKIQKQAEKFSYVKPRTSDKDGDMEVLDGITFTHHFVYGPGDAERVLWHYVEAGPQDGEVIVFLHGIPDSWYQWRHQMVVLATSHRCIGVDLMLVRNEEEG